MPGMRSGLHSLHKRKEFKTLPEPGISKLSFLDHVKRLRVVASARKLFSSKRQTFLLPLPPTGSVTWGNSLNLLVPQSASLQNKGT